MPHLFPGFSGMVLGSVIFIVAWLTVCLLTKGESFNIDAQNEKGAFEKILSFYHRCGEVLVGLASGSIVLLIGSFAFKQGHLPWRLASPLFLLAQTVSYSFLFMVLMTLNYEDHKHHPDDRTYTRFKYTRNQALGFGAMICFFAGYLWLIIVVTNFSD